METIPLDGGSGMTFSLNGGSIYGIGSDTYVFGLGYGNEQNFRFTIMPPGCIDTVQNGTLMFYLPMCR